MRAAVLVLGLVLLALGERALAMLVLLGRLLSFGEVAVRVLPFLHEDHSTQSNVRVTAFFHCAYSRSISEASIWGVHSLSLPQFFRRSS